VATVRTPAQVSALTAATRSAGVEVDVRALDVTDEDGVVAVVADVLDDHGRLDLLVNNAGVGAVGTLEELSAAALRRAMEVNFFGTAALTRAVIPVMRAGGGRIIAVSSIAGVFGQPFNDAYCASKCALEGLYESLHPVLAAFGVHVSLVEAGPVEGAFRDKSVGREPDPHGPYGELWSRFDQVVGQAYRTQQTPDDVADVIVRVSREVHPRLRYQTGPGVERTVGVKLADLDGDRVSRMTSRWLSG
jgi:NAD(P)-dependent dehydrogenase (short-subunit alcohol dehydrogenase family)